MTTMMTNATATTAATTTNNNNKLWNDLVEWVNNSSSANANDDSEDDEDVGGYVHPSLLLKQEDEGDKSSRGIFTTTTIAKGELLLRIPSYLIISGECESSKQTTAATAVAVAPAVAVPKPAVSSWLQCLGEFIRLKITAEEEENKKNNNSYQLPYLNSLPNYTEYETLHNWSSTSSSSTKTKNNNNTEEGEISFLKGTTLGNMVLHDRTNNITKVQYEISIKPYLNQLGLLLSDDVKNYELFLEASMCISTRGFHVLPTTDNDDDNNNNNNNNNALSLVYDGPFLLPVIDLLNHNPNRACTSLQRIQTTKSGGTYFTMVADRNISSQEELYHSYGNQLTSSQLLQTFGFVPIQYTYRGIAVEVVDEEIAKSMTDNDNNNIHVTTTTTTTISKNTNTDTNTTSSLSLLTPVSFKKEKHLLAATKHIKKSKTVSSYPDKLQEMIQKKSIRRSRDKNENDDNENDDDNDLYWDVHDIPTRLMNDLIIIPNNEFLVQSSSSSSLCSNSSSEDNININNNSNNNDDPPAISLPLLTEDMITLLAVQFLPEEAYTEIFPASSSSPSTSTSASAISQDQQDHDTSSNSMSMGSSSIRLDRSILVNDFYLGILVCYSLMMAIQLKSKEYNGTTSTSDYDNGNDTSVEVEVLLLGRSLVTMCQQEKDQIQTILRSNSTNSGEQQPQPQQCEQQRKRKQRELYGRTIRLEEMINLYKFYMEIQQLMTTILQSQSSHNENKKNDDNDNDNDNDEDYGSSSSSHHKKPKKAKIRL